MKAKVKLRPLKSRDQNCPEGIILEKITKIYQTSPQHWVGLPVGYTDKRITS